LPISLHRKLGVHDNSLASNVIRLIRKPVVECYAKFML
jgi:hypothetical protein